VKHLVLIIEDDPALQMILLDNLEMKGYDVLIAEDGASGYEKALTVSPDIIILDLMLPKMNGYEICSKLRSNKIDTPILMLTAKGEETDVILGLDIGADVYMKKPFSVKELMARCQSFMRRVNKVEQHKYDFGDFSLCIDQNRFFYKSEEIKLLPKEFKLLHYFLKNQGKALSRNDIIDNVWNKQKNITDRVVDNSVNNLRKVLEPDKGKPQIILTVREVGYRFNMPHD